MEHCLSPAAPPDKTASGAISPGPLRGHNSLSRLPDNFQRSRVTLLDCLLQEVNFLLSYRTKITDPQPDSQHSDMQIHSARL